MISIALVLALIIGVNQVFKVAADTVGTGQVLSAKTRDQKAAQAVFQNELSHAVVTPGEMPFFYIDSRSQAAFRNVKDEEGDLDRSAPGPIPPVYTTDQNGNNVEGEANVVGELSTPASTDNRVHRVDTLSFFARDLYRRQTGNSDTANTGTYPYAYVAQQSSTEAWITYQHLRVFNQDTTAGAEDNDLDYPPPGFPLPPFVAGASPPANTKNYYASDWILGRMAMLLVMPSAAQNDPPGTFPYLVYDRPAGMPQPSGNRQRFWMAMQALQNKDEEYLEPLGRETQLDNQLGTRQTPPPPPTITDSRYDLAGTSIGDMRSRVLKYLALQAQNTPNFIENWWDVLACSAAPAPEVNQTTLPPTGRFRCNPRPARPIDARKAAQAAPAMLANCTQFIVEYAGDFLTQNNDRTSPNYGDLVGNPNYPDNMPFHPDGTIDFIVFRPDPTKPIALPGNPPQPRVRWYGYPRDVTDKFGGPPDGVILGKPSTTGASAHNELVDVVPLRDVILAAPGGNLFNDMQNGQNHGAGNGMWFEKTDYKAANNQTVHAMPHRDVYRDDNNPVPLENYSGLEASDTAPNKGLNPENHYTCVWGPDDTNLPKMIRIVVRVDDPDGRLSDGQTYEYVINLP